MPKRCILTDSSCLLPNQSNAGSVPIFIIDLPIEDASIKVNYPSSDNQAGICEKEFAVKRITLPDIDTLHQRFIELTSEFDEVLCITLSSGILPFHQNIQKAASICSGNHKIRVIDSLSTVAGLGLMVKAAQRELNHQKTAEQTEAVIRSQIPNIFTALCTSDIFTLNANGLVDLPQAVISRMLGISVIYSIEDGFLSAVSKAKNSQAAVEFFVEYVSEFEEVDNVTFVHSSIPLPYDLSLLKDQVTALFPSIPLTQIPASATTNALFGANAFGLVIQQKH